MSKQKVMFCIGKYNPPHAGHYVTFESLIREAIANDAKPVVLVIDTGKRSTTSPLSGDQRTLFIGLLYPELELSVHTNAYTALMSLEERNYLPIGEVTGSDRNYVKDVARILKVDTTNYVNHTISREELSGTSYYSSTKVREAALNGDFDTFNSFVALPNKYSEQLFNAVRRGMGITDENGRIQSTASFG